MTAPTFGRHAPPTFGAPATGTASASTPDETWRIPTHGAQLALDGSTLALPTRPTRPDPVSLWPSPTTREETPR